VYQINEIRNSRITVSSGGNTAAKKYTDYKAISTLNTEWCYDINYCNSLDLAWKPVVPSDKPYHFSLIN